jgi:hypothetical protein
MTPGAMRIEIAKVYNNSPRIKNKLQAMHDNQIIAFYRRLQNEGKIK